jgi:hypothetical protein
MARAGQLRRNNCQDEIALGSARLSVVSTQGKIRPLEPAEVDSNR